MKKAFSYTLVLGAGVVVGALALKTFGDPAALLPGADQASKHAVLTALETVPPLTRSGDSNPVAAAAARLSPAVVRIHTVGTATPQGGGDLFQGIPFPGFGMPGMSPRPQAQRVEGAGSGVILSSDGYVLTNNHVVEDNGRLASKVSVTVGNKAYDARVIGHDDLTDIAVVKINTGGVRLTPAVLGNSDDVRVGDWAVAVGNPLDIGTSVTLGIISAVNRTNLSAENHPLQSVIQTDAAINPGNSGGALADIKGDVIGINEAIESPTGYYSGIGFAIPINAARKIAAELIQTGKAPHPYLGVAYKPLASLTAQEREQDGITLQGDAGVVVQSVSANSPASAAGLEPGDVVLQANGQSLTDVDTLNQITLSHNPGDTLTLQVSRNGKTMTVPVTLRQRPANYGAVPAQPADPQDQQAPQGIPFP